MASLWGVGVATLAAAMAVSFLVTPIAFRLARFLGAMDVPGGRRHHHAPVPRIGGVAVFAGFLAGMTCAAAATGSLLTVPPLGVYWRGLAFAATAMFLVGLVDDLWQISFLWKFAAQIAAAGYVWACGFRIEAISNPLGGDLDLGVLSFLVTVLWIVGITNAVNLIDGLDGLAAGAAAIMTAAVALIAAYRGVLGVTAASVALAGSLIGFLWFNFNPARIFLGDSGSMFIGFVLAVTAVRGVQKGPTVVSIFVPLLVLGLPVLDTTFAIFRRTVRLGSESLGSAHRLRYVARNLNRIFLPDRGHIHHRLVDSGLSQRNAVLTLYGVVVLMVAAAFSLVLLKSVLVALLLVSVLVALIAVFFVLVIPGSRHPRGAEVEPQPARKDATLTAAPPASRLDY